jgi:hypothetical protein
MLMRLCLMPELLEAVSMSPNATSVSVEDSQRRFLTSNNFYVSNVFTARPK